MEATEEKYEHRHHHHHEHHCRDKDCDDKDDKDDDGKKCKKDRRHHCSSHHIHELEKTIKTLADSLADLGRGSHLHELLRIIRWPGWTSRAELAFVNAILDHISVEVRTLERLQADLVEASRKVCHKHK